MKSIKIFEIVATLVTFTIHSAKNTHSTNIFIILRIFDVLPNFLSLQVKRCAIITYKHGIYDLPHDLPNKLRLKRS